MLFFPPSGMWHVGCFTDFHSCKSPSPSSLLLLDQYIIMQGEATKKMILILCVSSTLVAFLIGAIFVTQFASKNEAWVATHGNNVREEISALCSLASLIAIEPLRASDLLLAAQFSFLSISLFAFKGPSSSSAPVRFLERSTRRGRTGPIKAAQSRFLL